MNITLEDAIDNIKKENPDLSEETIEAIRDNTAKFINELSRNPIDERFLEVLK